MMIAFGTALLSAAQTADETPKAEDAPKGGVLALKEHTINVGEISGDSIVKATFTLYNSGTEDVVVTQIFSDCSCAVASSPKEAIAPGDSVQVKVSYDPKGYKWKEFRRVFRIRSNATNPYLSAVLKGKIAKKQKK